MPKSLFKECILKGLTLKMGKTQYCVAVRYIVDVNIPEGTRLGLLYKPVGFISQPLSSDR